VNQVGPVLFAIDDRLARFLHAVRAQRVGCARPAERGLGLFPRLQQRFIRPFRRKRRIGIVLVEMLNRVEGQPCRLAECSVKSLPNLIAYRLRHDGYTPQLEVRIA
jgi:hypothetical protein